MRVAFYGNNLNVGYFFVRMLRRGGIEATLICPKYRYQQEHNDWWTDGAVESQWVYRIPEVSIGAPVPLGWLPTVRKLYRDFQAYDALVLSENGPAVFSELTGGPSKILFAMGSDLIHLPYYLAHYLSLTKGQRFYRQHMKWAVRGQGRAVYEMLRSFDRFPREVPRRMMIQKRQRTGLQQCERIVCGPHHGEILDQLGLDRERVSYLNLPMDTSVLGEVDADYSLTLKQRNAEYDLVFFHPTRLYFLKEDCDAYLKDNDKLLRAFSKFLHETDKRVKLILVRKGREHDLLEAERIIADLQIQHAVEWLPETPNKRLRAYYQLPQVVVCDQFSSQLAVLGNVGREASYFGLPLITGFASWNSLRYGDDVPGHIFAADTEDQILSSMRSLATLSADGRRELGSAARAWFDRNHSEEGVIESWTDMITSCIR